MTSLTGEYEPSPWDWVRDQVAEYEASGGQRANTLRETAMPVIVVTTRGAKSGKVRKNPLMRVEHGGSYALVASKGGTPENPEWYHNIVSHPDEVLIQDGPEPVAVTVREVTGDEKKEWWTRAVAAYPPYAEYQQNTDRQIPVFVATPSADPEIRGRAVRPRRRTPARRPPATEAVTPPARAASCPDARGRGLRPGRS